MNERTATPVLVCCLRQAIPAAKEGHLRTVSAVPATLLTRKTGSYLGRDGRQMSV
jgi:hypothetical protein